MWGKVSIIAVLLVALAAFGNAPAKALLVDGSYQITLTGQEIDPSPGTFDVIGGTIQNFTMDLLSDGSPAGEDSTYSSEPMLTTVPTGSMFAGTVKNDFFLGSDNDTIQFFNDFTWVCAISDGNLCATSADDISAGDSGTYTLAPVVSAVPLPAAVWLFLSALGGLGLFGWRKRRTVA